MCLTCDVIFLAINITQTKIALMDLYEI